MKLMLIGDRKRRQQGGVLSGVLIITAFLSIIAGTVMTEVSSHFLISRSLVNKVATEATTTSAVEEAVNFLHSAPRPLDTSCSSLSPRVVTLNGMTAAASYVKCAAVISGNPSPGLTKLPSNSHSFEHDGTHVVLPGRDDYLIGDSNGDVYDYAFGGSTLRWPAFQIKGGQISGPPIAMPDGSRISYLVPVSSPNQVKKNKCRNDCVALLTEDAGSVSFTCFMDIDSGTVRAAPAAGQRFPNLTYFGDDQGVLFAYTATHDGNCAQQATFDGDQSVIAGPLVFPGSASSTDQIYVLVSDGSDSELVRYSYTSGKFTLADSLPLPFSTANGMALEQPNLPAKVAISFSDGGVAMVQIGTNFSLTLLPSGGVGTGINGAPHWCHCPGGADLIGLSGDNDTLYLLDAGMNKVASYDVGQPIGTTPAADSAGDWFVGAEDGELYEVVPPPGQSGLVLGATFGKAGSEFGTSTIEGDCGANICVYSASADGHAYLARLDARKADVVACITSSTPACQPGFNPRLWARIEAGSGADPKVIHIQGWSYYSP